MYAFAQPPAPGRESGNAAPAQPSTQAPSGPDATPQGQGFGGMGMLLIFALPLLLMIFMTRNQSKKQKQLEESLKVGDRVVTNAGLIGKITDLNERTAKIEIAPGVAVQMLKSAIQGPEPTAAPAGKEDKGKDAPKTDAVKEKK